jgi:hypothetical protein
VKNINSVSPQTRRNWLVDTSLFLGALLAGLSGIYFLFLPTGGFQGGHNPLYNLQILFSRQTWDDLHAWSGVAMIVVVAIHLVLHWQWIATMSQRAWHELTGKGNSMNSHGRWNLVLNTLVATSFLLTALSGVYFLFVPSGQRTADPMFLFARTTWDLIHTWAGVTFISSVVIHLAIHWKWVTKVTRKMFGPSLTAPPAQQTSVTHG